MTYENYKSERQLRGTQIQVAAQLGVTQVTMSRRESGGEISREAWLALLSLPETKEKYMNSEFSQTFNEVIRRAQRVNPALATALLRQQDKCLTYDRIHTAWMNTSIFNIEAQTFLKNALQIALSDYDAAVEETKKQVKCIDVKAIKA